MSSPRVGELIAANAKFAETWTTPPTMKQLREHMTDPILVLTCMDPRVVPEQFLGPRPLVAVFRNAGGRATPDVVRTINVVRGLAYKRAQEATVMVVHHTDCGMTHLTNDQLKDEVSKRGADGSHIDFGCFAEEDLQKSIQEDVQTLKADALLKDVDIRGYVLSTESGLLTEL